MVASRLYERIAIPNGSSLFETDRDTIPVAWPSAHLVVAGDCVAAGDCSLHEHALAFVRPGNRNPKYILSLIEEPPPLVRVRRAIRRS